MNQSVGLIVAPQLDVHAFAVRHAANEVGKSILIIGSAEFATEFDLVANFGRNCPSGYLKLKCGVCIDFSAISGLWWRRPRLPAVSHLVGPAFADVAARECREALFGSLNALIPRVFNNPGNSRAASEKAVQLAVATEVGLAIPSTLITNDPKAAREFYDRHGGNVIYKVFRGTNIGFYPTRLVAPEDVDNFIAIKGCPSIFQEYVAEISI
jgi:hypothetical protein